jgi:hypothetical protein
MLVPSLRPQCSRRSLTAAHLASTLGASLLEQGATAEPLSGRLRYAARLTTGLQATTAHDRAGAASLQRVVSRLPRCRQHFPWHLYPHPHMPGAWQRGAPQQPPSLANTAAAGPSLGVPTSSCSLLERVSSAATSHASTVPPVKLDCRLSPCSLWPGYSQTEAPRAVCLPTVTVRRAEDVLPTCIEGNREIVNAYGEIVSTYVGKYLRE